MGALVFAKTTYLDRLVIEHGRSPNAASFWIVEFPCHFLIHFMTWSIFILGCLV